MSSPDMVVPKSYYGRGLCQIMTVYGKKKPPVVTPGACVIQLVVKRVSGGLAVWYYLFRRVWISCWYLTVRLQFPHSTSESLAVNSLLSKILNTLHAEPPSLCPLATRRCFIITVCLCASRRIQERKYLLRCVVKECYRENHHPTPQRHA